MNLRRGSFRVFSVRGIDVKVHFTFLLLLVLFGALGLNEGLKGMVVSIFLILTIFLCVILHEMSHSLVAQRFGVMVKDITHLHEQLQSTSLRQEELGNQGESQ